VVQGGQERVLLLVKRKPIRGFKPLYWVLKVNILKTKEMESDSPIVFKLYWDSPKVSHPCIKGDSYLYNNRIFIKEIQGWSCINKNMNLTTKLLNLSDSWVTNKGRYVFHVINNI